MTLNVLPRRSCLLLRDQLANDHRVYSLGALQPGLGVSIHIPCIINLNTDYTTLVPALLTDLVENEGLQFVGLQHLAQERDEFLMQTHIVVTPKNLRGTFGSCKT